MCMSVSATDRGTGTDPLPASSTAGPPLRAAHRDPVIPASHRTQEPLCRRLAIALGTRRTTPGRRRTGAVASAGAIPRHRAPAAVAHCPTERPDPAPPVYWLLRTFVLDFL